MATVRALGHAGDADRDLVAPAEQRQDDGVELAFARAPAGGAARLDLPAAGSCESRRRARRPARVRADRCGRRRWGRPRRCCGRGRSVIWTLRARRRRAAADRRGRCRRRWSAGSSRTRRPRRRPAAGTMRLKTTPNAARTQPRSPVIQRRTKDGDRHHQRDERADDRGPLDDVEGLAGDHAAAVHEDRDDRERQRKARDAARPDGPFRGADEDAHGPSPVAGSCRVSGGSTLSLRQLVGVGPTVGVTGGGAADVPHIALMARHSSSVKGCDRAVARRRRAPRARGGAPRSAGGC